MAQFQTFESGVEVRGKVVVVLLDAMGHFKRLAIKILEKHGITDVTENSWYPQQAYLDAYREIYETIGAKTLKTIGKQIPEKALWPSGIGTVEEALASIDTAYHMNHRGGEIGKYGFEKTGERSAKMVCHNPYPCPFDHGIIEATANKFASGKRVKVKHDDTQPCRMKEGESCTYHISW